MFAQERPLCFQRLEHNINNSVCKAYGCYETYSVGIFPRSLYDELHGGIERAVQRRSFFPFVLSESFNVLGLGQPKFLRPERASHDQLCNTLVCIPCMES
jgi:hypothetical protein